MEFLRFGSNIPGSYWGCCAVCIIQNFKVDPEEKASIELVYGDSSQPVNNSNYEGLYAGPTWKDIFLQRLRIGTFNQSSMPNHVFLAVLTQSQVSGGVGLKWLKILKEQGFEFIRTTDNSVYNGSSIISEPGEAMGSSHKNHIFGLFRNIGNGWVDDPYTPPAAWTNLPSVVPEAWEKMEGDKKQFNVSVQAAQLPLYNNLPDQKTLLTQKQLEKQGVPVWIAGRRGGAIQHKKKVSSPAEPSSKAKKAPAPAPFVG